MSKDLPEPWWRGAMYEILVPSFQDANGDGWGDLPGVRRRLDYLEWLGISTLWLTPIYDSPLRDVGYDISDFTRVHPKFGTTRDLETLLDEAHQRGLRVVLDLVPNHTSDQHPWFQESRSSRTNPRREWYLWREGAPDGGPPNNWIDRYGRSAWKRDEATGQYYFYSFMSEQPDLNWRNPEVRSAMWEVMRFWLDRGVDGFRVDALPHLIKDERLRDNPPNPDYTEDQEPNNLLTATYSQNRPGVFEIIRQMRDVIDQYDDRALIGETYLPPTRLVSYYEAGLHFALNTSLFQQPFQAPLLRQFVDTIEGLYSPGSWPNWASGNHDLPRLAERIGEENLRLAALLQLTLRGTPLIYYGEEIGMRDASIPHQRLRDPAGIANPRHGRDPVRTPLQWSAAAHAGFTTGEPWLPVHEDYATRNIETQRDDPHSLLNLYQRLLTLRNAEPALHVGDYIPVNSSDENILAYVREDESSQFLVAINVGKQQATLEPGSRFPNGRWRVVVSTESDRAVKSFHGACRLSAGEGILARRQPI